ncbi:hypothetical protein, partial [Gaiella sp.]|uniref:hypothetical protein n=1 Tax=Gaiella sp. TaxID=2663207 RepID=UPI003264B2FB
MSDAFVGPDDGPMGTRNPHRRNKRFRRDLRTSVKVALAANARPAPGEVTRQPGEALRAVDPEFGDTMLLPHVTRLRQAALLLPSRPRATRGCRFLSWPRRRGPS